jgi:hypothetical protein
MSVVLAAVDNSAASRDRSSKWRVSSLPFSARRSKPRTSRTASRLRGDQPELSTSRSASSTAIRFTSWVRSSRATTWSPSGHVAYPGAVVRPVILQLQSQTRSTSPCSSFRRTVVCPRDSAECSSRWKAPRVGHVG